MKQEYQTRDGSVITLSEQEFNVYPKNIHLKLIEREASRTNKQIKQEVKKQNGIIPRKRRRTKTRIIS